MKRFCNNKRTVNCFALRSAKTLKIKNSIQEIAMYINPLNAELNPICHLLALLGAHHILHVSRTRVKQRRIVLHIKFTQQQILTAHSYGIWRQVHIHVEADLLSEFAASFCREEYWISAQVPMLSRGLLPPFSE